MALLFDKLCTGNTASIDSQTELGGSIPQTYSALRFHFVGRTTAVPPAPQFGIVFNNDTTALYDMHFIQADAGGVADAGSSIGPAMLLGHMIDSGEAAGRANQIIGEIVNYTGTAFFKSVVWLNSYDASASRRFYTGKGTWKVTDAVTRLTFRPDGGSFPAGSRLTLWGMNAV